MKEIMKRIIEFKNGKNNAIIEIFLIKNEEDKIILSICGSISSENHIIEAGQCIDTIAEIFKNERTKRIKEIWEEYHNNDMHLGCSHQREFEKEPYSKHAGHICPVCNYEYGTKWIYEEIPSGIIKELAEL